MLGFLPVITYQKVQSLNEILCEDEMASSQNLAGGTPRPKHPRGEDTFSHFQDVQRHAESRHVECFNPITRRLVLLLMFLIECFLPPLEAPTTTLDAWN